MPAPRFVNRDRSVMLILEDAARALESLPPETVDLVLTDMPWNTGVVQALGDHSYRDIFEDFSGFTEGWLSRARKVLKRNGTCIVHIGTNEAHTVRVVMDRVFGRGAFCEELIAHHEVGRLPDDGWGCKHSHILVYRNGPVRTFNKEHIPEVARAALAEKLGAYKRANSVLPATLVTTDRQRVGYPSQKHVGLYSTLVRVHSNPGALVLDPFAGSGTTGDAAERCGRSAILIDNNPGAAKVMCDRLALQPLSMLDKLPRGS